jgi:8-oxo-dGTP pyrophosphatase MutT (NUDIX family)
MTYKIFAAMKAFIVYEWKVLLIRESSIYEDGTNAWKYDVVWGRVEPWERFDECLIREIEEETWLEVMLWKPFHVWEWRPEPRWEKWQVIATFFECSVTTYGLNLWNDHSEYIWIDPKDYLSYDIIPNLKEAFENYLEYKDSAWTK